MEPAFFDRYVNNKMKNQVRISKLRVGDEVHEKAKEQAENMKKSFQIEVI